MGQKEEFAEQITYLTELLKLTWLSLLAVGGGTVSLVLGEPTVYRQIAAGAGMAVAVIFVLVLGYLHRKIRTEIRNMREVLMMDYFPVIIIIGVALTIVYAAWTVTR